MKSKMCDWFEVRLRKNSQRSCWEFSSIFSQIKEREGEAKEAYSCTLTEPSPKRDAELGKKTQEDSGQAI